MSYLIVDEKAGLVVEQHDVPSDKLQDTAIRYHLTHHVPVGIYEKVGEVTEAHVAKRAQLEADDTLRKQAAHQKVIADHAAYVEAKAKAVEEAAQADIKRQQEK